VAPQPRRRQGRRRRRLAHQLIGIIAGRCICMAMLRSAKLKLALAAHLFNMFLAQNG
jgi:hypothetical protein